MKLSKRVPALWWLAFLLAATACSPVVDENAPLADLGDFELGYAIVVAKNAQKVPPSREATTEEWEEALRTALETRFRRYEGGKLYHIGVNVDGYALAVPGIPVILSPKSALVISVTLWDDAAQKKVNEEPKQITVFEELTPGTLVGSGYTMTREEQIQSLARSAAAAIERWLADNRDWFGTPPTPDAATSAPGAEAGNARDGRPALRPEAT